MDFTFPDSALKEVKALLQPRKPIINGADEVWPKLFIGDVFFARNLRELPRYEFTHILNCAHTCGGDIYQGMGITYMGIEAEDIPSFYMSANFDSAADFIHTALTGGGKILVHCYAGVSRSATIVLAYLMLKENMTLRKAIRRVKKRRSIFPNEGFLKQLLDLHIKLHGC